MSEMIKFHNRWAIRFEAAKEAYDEVLDVMEEYPDWELQDIKNYLEMRSASTEDNIQETEEKLTKLNNK